MEIEIRAMDLLDLDQVMAIEEASFSHPWSRFSFVMELTENERARYLVGVAGTEVVGYVGLWLVLDEAHVTTLAVHPGWRGQGIGRQLMEAAITLARVAGCRRMTLEVRLSNVVAQHLYASLGFQAVGIRPGYYQDNDEDAVIMWKEQL